VRASSFIVPRVAQIGRKILPFTRARRERKVPASSARGRGKRCCSGPTRQWQRGAGPSGQQAKRKGRRYGSADAGLAQGEQRACGP
jgi:hypothetical protein